MAAPGKEVRYAGFKGINNVDAADRLGSDDLRKAVNVDLDNTGRVSRRKGASQVYSGANIRSLWSDNTTCLFAEGNDLNIFNSDYTATTLRSDLAAGSEVSYTGVNGVVYYSDGAVTGVVQGNTNRNWGIPVPANQPALAAAAGAMGAGAYQVAITYQAADGRESGARVANEISLSGFQGIMLSNIPASPDGTVTKVNIYCTQVNGDRLYLAGSVANGTTSYTINGGIFSIPLRTQFMSPPPPGTIVVYNDGRMYVAVGGVLYYSEPYALEWFRLATNFYAFSEAITLVAPVEGGLFVSADRTYWIDGNRPDEAQAIEVSLARAIPGTVASADAAHIKGAGAGTAQIWLSDKGVCLGRSAGAFEILTEGRYSPPSSTGGSALFRRQNGLNQYIGLLKDTSQPADNAYVGDVATATVVRNGIVVQ